MLPISRTGSEPDVFMPALFTSVSAVCVTGLITVDTATFWTPFGQGVILGLIQAGGFGIMTLATLLALLVRKNIGLRGQLVAQSETHTLNLGDFAIQDGRAANRQNLTDFSLLIAFIVVVAEDGDHGDLH